MNWIASILAALLSWWRGRDRAQVQQQHVVEAYRREAELEARPDRPWRETVDDL